MKRKRPKSGGIPFLVDGKIPGRQERGQAPKVDPGVFAWRYGMLKLSGARDVRNTLAQEFGVHDTTVSELIAEYGEDGLRLAQVFDARGWEQLLQEARRTFPRVDKRVLERLVSIAGPDRTFEAMQVVAKSARGRRKLPKLKPE